MKKILIIEDEDRIRENISDALTLTGYKIYTAENGLEGVHLSKQINPDLILCDIMMPVLDGYGVLKAIKNDEKSTLIPFIFISAKSNYEDIRTGMNLGADDYLIKPFLLEDLLKMVEAKLVAAEKKQKTYFEKQQQLIEQYGLIQMHELNTPMNGILTSVSLLQDLDLKLTPSESAELLQIINISGKRLHRSISNLFFYEQIKNGKYTFYSETIRETSIQIAIENIAKNYNRSTDFIILIDKHSIEFDRKLLMALLTELIDNAFKFTRTNDQVLFSYLRTAKGTEIRVQHYNRNKFELIEFENSQPFNQFKKEIYEQAGIGLGLSIIKLICKQYGMNFKYEIDNNNNAVFTLIIP